LCVALFVLWLQFVRIKMYILETFVIIALHKSTFTTPYHLPLWLPVICNSLYTFLLSTVVFTYEDLEAFMYVFFAELFAKLTVKTLVADNFKFRTMTSYSLTPTNTSHSHSHSGNLTHFPAQLKTIF